MLGLSNMPKAGTLTLTLTLNLTLTPLEPLYLAPITVPLLVLGYVVRRCVALSSTSVLSRLESTEEGHPSMTSQGNAMQRKARQLTPTSILSH